MFTFQIYTCNSYAPDHWINIESIPIPKLTYQYFSSISLIASVGIWCTFIHIIERDPNTTVDTKGFRLSVHWSKVIANQDDQLSTSTFPIPVIINTNHNIIIFTKNYYYCPDLLFGYYTPHDYYEKMKRERKERKRE